MNYWSRRLLFSSWTRSIFWRQNLPLESSWPSMFFRTRTDRMILNIYPVVSISSFLCRSLASDWSDDRLPEKIWFVTIILSWIFSSKSCIAAISKERSTLPRPFYCHLTAVTVGAMFHPNILPYVTILILGYKINILHSFKWCAVLYTLLWYELISVVVKDMLMRQNLADAILL